MNIPDHLRYTPDHLWVQVQPDGSVHAGITDYAQETLGDIVYVDSPGIGSHVEAGQPCGVVESVKTASDLHAPLSGTVTAVNPDLQNTPELINENPYAAWIFAIQPSDASLADGLLDAESYRNHIAA